MQTTNKRIAFYTAIIGTILSVLLPALGLDIPAEQQETLVAAMLMICAVFGIGDIGWDYINATRGNFDVTVTETKTVVGTAENQTLTNKTLTPPAIETKTVERNVSIAPAPESKVTTDVSLAG